MSITEFKLTENHLKLLHRMYVDFDDSAYDGAPAVDIKRPYGNSDTAGDVAEILGLEYDLDDDMPEELVERCLALHHETATALQIVLCTQSFKPGLYRKSSQYNDRSWELVL